MRTFGVELTLGNWLTMIKDNKNINILYDLYDGNKIMETFEELIVKGQMVKKYDLYYFT